MLIYYKTKHRALFVLYLAQFEVMTYTGQVDGYDAPTSDAVFLHIHGSKGSCEEFVLRPNSQPRE